MNHAVRNLAEAIELVDETGDHPLNGVHCPGRHRAPWTVETVRFDARTHLIGRLREHVARHRLNESALPTWIDWGQMKDLVRALDALDR